MTQEELKNYLTLNDKFVADCKRVCSELSRINFNLDKAYKFYIDEDEVSCEGSYSCCGDLEYVYEFFPKELLTFSDQELTLYVDTLIKKKKEEEEKENMMKKQRQAECDMKEYQRLKTKLGL